MSQIQHHLLPIDISGQRFMLPMANAAFIHRLSGAEREGIDLGEADPSTAEEQMPVYDLSMLFYEKPGESSSHVIVLSSSNGNCAVVVDGLYSAVHITPGQYQPISQLVTGQGTPFNGVVNLPDVLALVIDVEKLVQIIRHGAELKIMEPDNA